MGLTARISSLSFPTAMRRLFTLLVLLPLTAVSVACQHALESDHFQPTASLEGTWTQDSCKGYILERSGKFINREDFYIDSQFIITPDTVYDLSFAL